MKYVLALIAGALGCLLLAFYTAHSRRATIQEDLRNHAKNALTQAPVRQLVITADGREITLRGSVPNEAAKRSAGKAVENAEGVRTVTNLLEIAKVNDAGPAAAVTATQAAATACQEEFTAALRQEQIQFEPNWYAIQAASFPLLDRLVTAASNCPTAHLEISGHTDSYGLLENNMALSRARAQEVANYLIAKGVPAARLSVVGHGPNQPVADNSTAEGKQKNRRIDFTVISP
jgi:outer membrane protein OmpA-like peptidoglycan-associated protein